ncbi:HAD family hydrolase [Gallaecimonas mangrovi]|uniref:HAD family hydrolase n=1 Tax=Gallaecimonas mangrovi TaxID=2291597 RepID=UPI000E204828|nr:HAD family phosphatase [Gallaecimonas mangrovi]
MITAVIFDHDGTLVDSEQLHYVLWQRVLKPLGLQLEVQDYQAHYAGIPALENAQRLVQHFDLSISPSALAEQKARLSQRFLQQHPFPLLPGVAKTLAAFQQAGIRMAIATGANQYAVDATCRFHRLSHFFEAIVSRDDVQHGKPHPQTYQLALSRLRLSAADCLAVEDTVHGMKAALAAKLPCVVVPSPMSKAQDFTGAAASFSSMAAVKKWVLAQQ